jgi:hypothetical protein
MPFLLTIELISEQELVVDVSFQGKDVKDQTTILFIILQVVMRAD